MGECVNNDVCDCSKTKLVGRRCNEYVKITRIKLIDYLIRIVVGFFSIATLCAMGLIIYYRNYPEIKGGNNLYI